MQHSLDVFQCFCTDDPNLSAEFLEEVHCGGMLSTFLKWNTLTFLKKVWSNHLAGMKGINAARDSYFVFANFYAA